MFADVFVGGVLSTLSALAIGFDSFVVGVRAGAEDATSPRLAIMVTVIMAKSIRVTAKKKRGRPATTGTGIQIGERWHPAEIEAIDAWIASSADKTISRAHAIRRLVALGLKAKK